MRGQYWHLTINPDFQIDAAYCPRDASTLSSGGPGANPGLMVSGDIECWYATLGTGRSFAAQIDISSLIPDVDYVNPQLLPPQLTPTV